jgi:hypothetical protein
VSQKTNLFSLMLMLSVSLWAGGPELKLVMPRTTMLPGEPLNFKATFINPTSGPIGISLIHWQVPTMIAVSSAGKELLLDTVNFWKFPPGTTVGPYGEIQIPANGSFDFLNVNYQPALSFMEPGTFRVHLVYKSPGRVYAHVPPRPGEKEPPSGCGGCWAGELTSNEVTVTVQEPAGDDAKAYEKYFAPVIVAWDKYRQPSRWERRPPTEDRYADLVAEFPSSTYAAWVKLRHVHSWVDSDVSPWKGYENLSTLLNSTRSLYQSGHPPCRSEDARPAFLIDELRQVLAYHPDLEPMASVARVELGVLLYISGDTTGAKEQLKTVLKAHPDWEEGRAAKRMLDVISVAPATPLMDKEGK